MANYFSRIVVSVAIVAGATSSLAVFAGNCALDNLGEHKPKLTDYKTSGEYDTDVAAVVAQVKQFLQERLSSTP